VTSQFLTLTASSIPLLLIVDRAIYAHVQMYISTRSYL